jgi:hypothetical protein
MGERSSAVLCQQLAADRTAADLPDVSLINPDYAGHATIEFVSSAGRINRVAGTVQSALA